MPNHRKVEEDFSRWVYLDGYKIPYRINDDGVLQGFFNHRWRTKALNFSGQSTRPYYSMTLADGKRKNIPAVNLVIDAFLGGRKPGASYLHKNGNKFDCSVYNLKPVTQSYIATNCGGRSKRKAVEKIDREGNVLELYRSEEEAAKKNYISQNSVSRRCRNKIKGDPFKLAGFSFRFEKTN